MRHPDYAFSPSYYIAPAGLDDEPCRHGRTRMRVGPTGRRTFWLTVDQCCWCGRILRSAGPDLTWRQYDWVRRWNMRTDR